MISIDCLANKKTHMPYLANGPSGIVMFFCMADENGKWRLHYLEDGGSPVRIETGITGEGTECAPIAWFDQGGWHICYISGGEVGNRTFYLRSITGQSLTSLSAPYIVRRGALGFVRPGLTVVGEKHEFIYLEREGSEPKRLFIPGSVLYAVSYPSDNQNKLLISLALEASPDVVFCVEYDLITGEQNMVECDGGSAYKCSMLGGDVVYPKRMSQGFEDRAICIASSVDRIPTNVIFGEIDMPVVETPARPQQAAPQSPLACIHRGPILGTVGCGCGAAGSRMSVYECKELGICTLRSPNKAVQFNGATPNVCLGCQSMSL